MKKKNYSHKENHVVSGTLRIECFLSLEFLKATKFLRGSFGLLRIGQ